MESDQSETDKRLLQQQAQAWVLRIKSGQATPSDLQALRQWCATGAGHAHAFEQARHAWDEIGQVGRVYRAMHPDAVAKHVDRPNRRMILGAAFSVAGAAAVVAVVRPPLGIWPSIFELNSDYRTATGEQRRIELANGIRIDLNTQSSLSVRAEKDEEQGRDEIELISGEVAIASEGIDRMLQVVAGKGRLALASGEIEVRLIEDYACVTCLRGGVEVRHPARTVALRASEQVIYDDQSIAAARVVESTLVSAWRDGALVFRNTLLADAVAEINRYRPGRVVLLNSSLGERRVSGKFQIARLDLAIDRIQEAFGARIRKLPGNVILLS